MSAISKTIQNLSLRNIASLLLISFVVILPAQLQAQQVNLTNRTLVIAGDRYADDIEIEGINDFILVYGDGRYIRYYEADDIDVIDVLLEGGNDTFKATGIHIPGVVNVHSGSGNDTINISDINVDELTVLEGDDINQAPAYSFATVNLTNVRADYCQVQCYDVTVNEGRFDNCEFHAAFQDIRHVSTWKFFSLNDADSRLTDMILNDIQANIMYVISDIGNNVEDTIHMSSIRTWTLGIYSNSHEDYVRLTGSQIMGRIDIHTGQAADDDFVYLNNVYSQGRVRVENGGGDDDVYMIQCDFESSVDVQTAGGNDFAYCYNCDIGTSYISQLGSGNDRQRFSRSFTNTAYLRGGTGTQDRLELYRSTIRSLDQREFETVID